MRTIESAAFLSTSQPPPLPCYGTTVDPLRLHPLHDPRLAMPLREEAWLNRGCGALRVRRTVSKGAVNFFTGAKLLGDVPSVFPPPASLTMVCAAPRARVNTLYACQPSRPTCEAGSVDS